MVLVLRGQQVQVIAGVDVVACADLTRDQSDVTARAWFYVAASD